MKFCYVDESGLGKEPYLIMVGIIVDAQRMHKTKTDWEDLLKDLSGLYNRKVTEFHTRKFYRGIKHWRKLDGKIRSRLISAVLDWLRERKHKITFSGVDRTLFMDGKTKNSMLARFHSDWCFVSLHLILTIQKHFQNEPATKGNTLFVFDKEMRHKTHLAELLRQPPEWIHEYYAKSSRKAKLNQIIDVPYYGDSADVYLIQVADLICFLTRKYVEIEEGFCPSTYPDEKKKIDYWIKCIIELSLPTSARYPATRRNPCSELFYRYAPQSLRGLGR